MRFYLSNLRLTWPFERQEAIIAARFPEWRSGAVYRDELSVRKLKAHDADALTNRALMLRPTTRRGGTLYVPSLAVLAFTPADLAVVLAALGRRLDALVSLEDDTAVAPDGPMGDALEAFKSAVRRVGDYGKPGGIVSGERRAAAAKAGCERIRERWGMPSEEWSTEALCDEAGVSRPTAFQYLGRRSIAQRDYVIRQALAERNRSRRKQA